MAPCVLPSAPPGPAALSRTRPGGPRGASRRLRRLRGHSTWRSTPTELAALEAPSAHAVRGFASPLGALKPAAYHPGVPEEVP